MVKHILQMLLFRESFKVWLAIFDIKHKRTNIVTPSSAFMTHIQYILDTD